MIVKVSLFAAAKDVIGENSIDLVLDDDATVGALKQAIVERYPSMMEIVEKSAISVDQEYSVDSKPLYHGAEVGVIPPVSGG